MQVTCDRATRYELNGLAMSTPVAAKPAESQIQASETPAMAQTMGRAQRIPGQATKKETPTKETIKEEMPVPDNVVKASERKRLIVTLQQTHDANADITLLHQLMAILAEYPGLDELSLVVSNGTKVFRLKMGQVRVAYCDDLGRRVAQLLGAEALKIEKVPA